MRKKQLPLSKNLILAMCASNLQFISTILQFVFPIVIVIIGFRITKKIELIKSTFEKEKEFKSKWADLLLVEAVQFNSCISKYVSLLSVLASEEDEIKTKEIGLELIDISFQIKETEWNIRNFTQFSPIYNQDVIKKQTALMEKINSVYANKCLNFEEVRYLQFQYNEAIRNAHSDLLK